MTVNAAIIPPFDRTFSPTSEDVRTSATIKVFGHLRAKRHSFREHIIRAESRHNILKLGQRSAWSKFSVAKDIHPPYAGVASIERAQIEEKYINAKNRLDFNRRRNNLAGDRLKQDQQEVALFLEKLREVQSLERECFQLNPEQNDMESDEIYDTTDSEIDMNLSNDASDTIEDKIK